MIKQITLKFGRAEDTAVTYIDTTPITVFVGPNNSGKSKILSEIQQFCCNGIQNTNNLILESIELNSLTDEQIESKLEKIILHPEPQEIVQKDNVIIGKWSTRQHVPLEQLKQALKKPNSQKVQICQWLLRFDTLILNGNNRINLVNEQNGGNLQQPAITTLQALFRNDNQRIEARRIVYEAFNQYLVIDPTNLGKLNLRLSSILPKDNLEERGIHDEAVSFHKNALPISQTSDGVKAFTGIILEMIAGDPSVLLMDEPEAFLHPSLSFKLGKEVSNIMSHSDKRLFVSTHSPEFVMGCIQSGAPVNIVRLTYRDKIPTARILPNEDILKLMRNPLLRSTGVLAGIFYECVVVTEADTDRAFYQEINDRLMKYSNSGIRNCLFVNAQNKQTLKTIIKPLRQLGIPVAGIIDIDVLKDGGCVWSDLLGSCFIPEMQITALGSLRQNLKKAFESSGKDMKKDGGREILNKQEQESFDNFTSTFADYGLFIVPKGEVESWLPNLKCEGHGPSWLIKIFEEMGEDPTSSKYVKPDTGDVWDFINSISKWLENGRRKGIPD